MSDKPKLVGLPGQEQPPELPAPKLTEFPLATVGDQLLQVLGAFGITAPFVFIVVGDVDTGEAVSSANLEKEDQLDLLRMLLAQHEDGRAEDMGDGKHSVQ